MAETKLPKGFPPGATDIFLEHGQMPLAVYKGEHRLPLVCWLLHYMDRVAGLEAKLDELRTCEYCGDPLDLPEGWALTYCKTCCDRDEGTDDE